MKPLNTSIFVYASRIQVGRYILGCLLNLLTLTAYAQPLSVTVESFNVRYDNPDDGINAWPNRQNMVREHILKLAPDVIGMQEVLSHQLNWLSSELADYRAIGVGRDDGKKQGEFVPILYNAQHLKLVQQDHFWLSETPNIPGSVGWGADLPRIVTWACFYKQKQAFYVFNAHFSHVSEQARRQSAHFLAAQIKQIAGNHPVILTGDFNAQPNEPAYQVLTKQATQNLKDSALLISGTKPDTTWNGFGEAKQPARLDYVLISDPWHVKSYKTHRVIQQGVYISDHFPVSVILTLPQQAP